jgi:hypothetical protein
MFFFFNHGVANLLSNQSLVIWIVLLATCGKYEFLVRERWAGTRLISLKAYCIIFQRYVD